MIPLITGLFTSKRTLKGLLLVGGVLVAIALFQYWNETQQRIGRDAIIIETVEEERKVHERINEAIRTKPTTHDGNVEWLRQHFGD